MEAEESQVGWVFWLQWVLASAVGMYLGFNVGFLLTAVIHLVLGLGLELAFSLFGVALGMGVGVLQWLVLRRRVSVTGWWVLASAAGGYGVLLAGFLGFSQSLESHGLLLSWTGVVALGGAVTGVLQWLLLRARSPELAGGCWRAPWAGGWA